MSTTIRFYEDVTTDSELLQYKAVTPLLVSETLWDSLIWSRELTGKGDETGLKAFVSKETLQTILDEDGQDICKELELGEYEQLQDVVSKLDECDFLYLVISQ